jgi:hypothetical protein
MTCAGLLGLAFGYGGVFEATMRTGSRPKSGKTGSGAASDPAKDTVVRSGFVALSQAVGQPLEDPRQDGLGGGLGDMYYFLWSLERVAVAYGVPTIGGKDWYSWGSGVLIVAQRMDGGWMGKFGTDVDTCFALLFLRRANLAQDLTAYLKGPASVEFALKAGAAQGEASKPKADPASPAEEEKTAATPAEPKTIPERGPNTQPPAERNTEAEAGRLKMQLLQASGPQQEQLMNQLKQAKGVAYTEALASAIPQLNGALKTKARDALAERLARMTVATLRDKLKDEAPEIRRAAALACAAKADQEFVPHLIPLLEDREVIVVRAAHTALKHLTGQDLGPAVAAWKEWLKSRPEGR